MWPTLDRVRVDVDLDALTIRRHNAVVETGLYAGSQDRAGNSDDGLASANVPAWIVARQRYIVAQYAAMHNRIHARLVIVGLLTMAKT